MVEAGRFDQVRERWLLPGRYGQQHRVLLQPMSEEDEEAVGCRVAPLQVVDTQGNRLLLRERGQEPVEAVQCRGTGPRPLATGVVIPLKHGPAEPSCPDEQVSTLAWRDPQQQRIHELAHEPE